MCERLFQADKNKCSTGLAASKEGSGLAPVSLQATLTGLKEAKAATLKMAVPQVRLNGELQPTTLNERFFTT